MRDVIDIVNGRITYTCEDIQHAEALADELYSASIGKDGKIIDHGWYDDARQIYAHIEAINRGEEAEW